MVSGANGLPVSTIGNDWWIKSDIIVRQIQAVRQCETRVCCRYSVRSCADREEGVVSTAPRGPCPRDGRSDEGHGNRRDLSRKRRLASGSGVFSGAPDVRRGEAVERAR